MPHPALIHRDPVGDWLCVLEFGRVADGQPADHWRELSEHCGLLFDRPGGRVVGARVDDFSELDLDALDAEGLFESPRFDVPTLGLRAASIGEICLATRAFLPNDEPSLDMAYFHQALAAAEHGDLGRAEEAWRLCLEAGAMEAHYGLGYTRLSLGRPHEAYRHLRHYSEINPADAWAWCWRGQAAEALGEVEEARQSYERAVELERDGSFATDAGDRLEGLRPAGG